MHQSISGNISPHLQPEVKAPSLDAKDYLPRADEPSLHVIQSIATLHQFDEITFLKHSVGINWRQRHPDDQKVNHLGEDCFGHNDSKDTKMYPVKRSRLSELTVEYLLGVSASNEVFSVGSKVQKDGEEFHIPMMNFHPEVENGREFVVNCLLALQERNPDLVPPGVLVDSGRYFHYYGMGLIPAASFNQYLAAFLMPSVLVSPRYIGHSLSEGQCSLRITHDKTFKPQLPKVTQHIISQ